jgi:acetylornithine/succinyldiaminopimelate/putrescine aminotransferase
MRLAGRLSELSLGGKVFFTNSGAEAIECAIKLSRKHKRGGGIVVLEDGFHGRTYGALSATPQETKQAPFAPLVPASPQCRATTPMAVAAGGVADTAAVIIEPIQGESGIHPIAEEVLRAARDACDEHGALLVFDEIQCGMGRTGALWAWQHVEVQPDVMTVAKGLGGGLPIGACCTAPDYADVLERATTARPSRRAGDPRRRTRCSDVVDDAELLVEVTDHGETLAEGLRGLGLDDVRGRGLMLAFETRTRRMSRGSCCSSTGSS